MTKRGALEVALKIVGVMCVVWGLVEGTGSLIRVLMDVFRGHTTLGVELGTGGYSAWWLLRPGVYLALAWGLLFRTEWITAKLIREDGAVPELGTLEIGPKLFTFVLRVIGVVVIIRGLIDASFLVVMLIQRAEIGSEFALYCSYIALRAVIGIYLLTGATQFVKWVYREARTPETVDRKP